MKHRGLSNDFAGASSRERRRPRRPPIWLHPVRWLRAAPNEPSREHIREPVTPCQGYPTTLQARNPGNAGALAGPQSGCTTSCGYVPRPTNQAVSIYGNQLDPAGEGAGAPGSGQPSTPVHPRDLLDEVATIAHECVTPDIAEAPRVTQRLRRRVILGAPAPSPAPYLDAPLPVDTCRDQRTKP